MNESSTKNTNERPVSVRLSLNDWLRVAVAIVIVTGGQSWVASRYVTKLEGRIENTEKGLTLQEQEIRATQLQLQSVKDSLNAALIPLARDIGEIKGKLEILVDQKRGQ